MLVVRAEIWPGGDADAGYQVGEIKVANESDLAELSNYSAEVTQMAAPSHGVTGIATRVQVNDHYRRDGAWALILRVLEIALAERAALVASRTGAPDHASLKPGKGN